MSRAPGRGMIHPIQESFIRNIAAILHLGFTLSDAMKQITHGSERTASLHFDGQDWIIETLDTPRRMIQITRVE